MGFGYSQKGARMKAKVDVQCSDTPRLRWGELEYGVLYRFYGYGRTTSNLQPPATVIKVFGKEEHHTVASVCTEGSHSVGDTWSVQRCTPESAKLQFERCGAGTTITITQMPDGRK